MRCRTLSATNTARSREQTSEDTGSVIAPAGGEVTLAEIELLVAREELAPQPEPQTHTDTPDSFEPPDTSDSMDASANAAPIGS